MTAVPDVANFTAVSGTAVPPRHAFTDDIVRHDVWLDTSQVAANGGQR